MLAPSTIWTTKNNKNKLQRAFRTNSYQVVKEKNPCTTRDSHASWTIEGVIRMSRRRRWLICSLRVTPAILNSVSILTHADHKKKKKKRQRSFEEIALHIAMTHTLLSNEHTFTDDWQGGELRHGVESKERRWTDLKPAENPLTCLECQTHECCLDDRSICLGTSQAPWSYVQELSASVASNQSPVTTRVYYGRK